MSSKGLEKNLVNICKKSDGRKSFSSVHRFIWPFYIKKRFKPEEYGWEIKSRDKKNAEWYSTYQYLSNNANKIFDKEICKMYLKKANDNFYLIEKSNSLRNSSYNAIEYSLNGLNEFYAKFGIESIQDNLHFFKQGIETKKWHDDFKDDEKCYIFDDECYQWVINEDEALNYKLLSNENSLEKEILVEVFKTYSSNQLCGPIILKKINEKICVFEISDNNKKYDLEITTDKLKNNDQIILDPIVARFDVIKVHTNENKIDVDLFYDFKLPIADYEMHIYDDNVGFLFINCINLKFHNFNEINRMKMINDFGRRVEIPYFPSSGTGITADKLGIVKIDFKNNNQYFGSNFKAYIDNYNSEVISNEELEKSYKPSSFLANIIFNSNKEKTQNAETTYLDLEKNTEERMFAMTLVNIPSLCCEVKKLENLDNELDDPKKIAEYYQAIETLYPIIFNDYDDASCQNLKMREELFFDASNLRWTHYGTLHAVTQYSFTCITSIMFAFDAVALPFINIYTYLCSIVLAQRYMLLDFADKYTNIIIKGDKVGSLIKDYAVFKNELLLTELSTQEQGIEIYRRMRKQILVDSELEELESQMSYLNESVEYEFNNKMNFLSFYGTLIAIILYFQNSVIFFLDEAFKKIKLYSLVTGTQEFFKFDSNINFYLFLIACVFFMSSFINTKFTRSNSKLCKMIEEKFKGIGAYIIAVILSIIILLIILGTLTFILFGKLA